MCSASRTVEPRRGPGGIWISEKSSFFELRASELDERVLEAFERLDVQIVRRLVEQQQVAALLEREREVEAVALAAGQHTGELLLVGSLETEARDIGARRHFDAADLDEVVAVGDRLPQVLVRVEARAVLVDVADLDGLADLEVAARKRFEADDRLEERRLADAVRADDADDAVAWQCETQVVDEHTVAERLVDVLGFEDRRTQTRSRRDLDLGEVELLRIARLLLHLVVAFETRLVLRLTCLRRRADPFEFVLEALRELRVLRALDLHALRLRLEIRRVVALVRVELAAVDFANPFRDVVHEVAVVRDGDDGAGVLVQELLKPQDRFCVEVVRRLVEQQQVGRLKQQLAQCDAAAFATRAYRDRRVRVGALQRVHRLFELRVEVPAVRRDDLGLQLAHVLHQRVEVGVRVRHLLADLVEPGDLLCDVAERHLDVLADGLVVVERRLLLEDADAVAGRERRFAVAHRIEPRHDLEQCRLAHAVRADDADLRARKEAQRDVVEDHAVSIRLTGVNHLIDKLSQG